MRRPSFSLYGRRMAEEITHPVFGYRLGYRRMLILHARMIAAWLCEEIPTLAFLTTVNTPVRRGGRKGELDPKTEYRYHDHGAFSAKSIERILAVQARPKTCWDRMAEEEPSHLRDLLSDDPTSPRSATDYQHLLFEESDRDDQSEEKDDADPEPPRRTLLSIFVSASWTTPRRSRFPCPPRFSTRRWPTPIKRGCPT